MSVTAIVCQRPGRLGFPPSPSDVHDSGDTVGITRRHLAIKQVYTSTHDVVLDMGPLKSVTVGGFAKVVWHYLKLVALSFSPPRALALPRGLMPRGLRST